MSACCFTLSANDPASAMELKENGKVKIENGTPSSTESAINYCRLV
jgi:hypothetical protein